MGRAPDPEKNTTPAPTKRKVYLAALDELVDARSAERMIVIAEGMHDCPERRELARRAVTRLAAAAIGDYLAEAYTDGNPSPEQRRVIQAMHAVLEPAISVPGARRKATKDAQIKRAIAIVKRGAPRVQAASRVERSSARDAVLAEIALVVDPKIVDLDDDEREWALDVLLTYTPSKNPTTGTRSANAILGEFLRRWRLLGHGPWQGTDDVTRTVRQAAKRR